MYIWANHELQALNCKLYKFCKLWITNYANYKLQILQITKIKNIANYQVQILQFPNLANYKSCKLQILQISFFKFLSNNLQFILKFLSNNFQFSFWTSVFIYFQQFSHLRSNFLTFHHILRNVWYDFQKCIQLLFNVRSHCLVYSPVLNYTWKLENYNQKHNTCTNGLFDTFLHVGI